MERMNKEEAFERWDKAIFGNPCVRCLIDPPKDRSICSDCVSSHARERAMKVIEQITKETGYRCNMKYERGKYIFKLEPVEKQQ